MRKQLSYYLIFVVLYAGLTVAGVFTPFILPGIVVLVGMMLPMSSVGYDDQARWDKYAAATPAGRAGMVAARYLSALIVLVAGSALILVLMLVLGLLLHAALALHALWLDIALYLGLMAFGFWFPVRFSGPFRGWRWRIPAILAFLLGALILLFTFFPPAGVLFADLS